MIKRFGLAAMAACLAFALPAASTAAPAKEAPAASKPYEKEQLAKGAKEGPAVLAKTQLKCTATGWGYAGQGTVKDPTTKKDIKQNVYEVSCQEGLGYSLIETVGSNDIQSFDCVTLNDSTSAVKCRLPANMDPKAELQPLATATGRQCTVTNTRPVGATKSGEAYYEVGCQQGEGFVIKTGGAKPEAIDCAQLLGGNIECKLTTREQIEAAQKAKLNALIAKSGRTCTISGTRSVGRLTTGEDLYEVACGPSAGFMLRAKPDGSAIVAVDCAKAQAFAGGCQLTNSAVAQTQEKATYTRLARQSGFPCDVAKYNFIGLDEKTKAEVVELACTNRPDGGVAMFPADNSPGQVYDCVAAGALGVRCQLSSPEATYSKYTQALVAKGKTTCKVSNARWIGHYAQENSDLIETACADGKPGWVVEIAKNQARSVLSCGQARSQGQACQLPGNK